MFCLSISFSKARPLWISSLFGPVQAMKAATQNVLGCEAKLVTIWYVVHTFNHFGQFWARLICNSTLGGNGTYKIKADGCASAISAVLWAPSSGWGMINMSCTPRLTKRKIVQS